MEGPRQGIRPRLLTAVTATATAGAIGAGYGAFIVSRSIGLLGQAMSLRLALACWSCG